MKKLVEEVTKVISKTMNHKTGSKPTPLKTAPKTTMTSKVVKVVPIMPKPSNIAVMDRIKQADAAHILGCTRQRVSERIKQGSLKYAESIDALGHKTRFVSLKQVRALKEEIDKVTKKSA